MLALIFNINNNKYAINVDYIHEAIPRQKITPLAGASGAVAGVTEVRGTLYTCVDLSGLLFNVRGKWSEHQIFLLGAVDKTYVSMIVDSVSNVADLDMNTLDKSVLKFSDSKMNTVSGFFKYQDNLVSLLDMDGVVTKISSFIEPIKTE